MAVLMTPAQTAKMERMTHARNTSASLLTYFTPTNTTVAMEVNRMVPYTRMLLSRAASASAPSRPSRGNMAALGTMQICRGKELIYLSLTLCIQGNQQYFYLKKKIQKISLLLKDILVVHVLEVRLSLLTFYGLSGDLNWQFSGYKPASLPHCLLLNGKERCIYIFFLI